ncbi:alpha-(1-_3)-arabinofuranosyltransferase family protein [Marmoricola sp. URHB0036]|uniref:alpha-(1->3)-arabinofuranosyltransferase domain-containing protein n=1 Tax=Marmoricola sp. URHB0036 TaxID=1298863 RepID=UPI000486F793|nr:alpha-(1->3)-arabinofuranosyltransferase family protein [Marmoricola sp. URHB0036]
MRFRTAVRLLAVCLLLVGLAFIQNSGFLVSDTKFDLAVSPQQFLERALHLWDDGGAFGQLQNQAYGYLWPMGPFFALLHAAAVPGWIVQRLWQALIMIVAFLGTVRVVRALGVRSDLASISAGLAFALSPRMLTVLGPISIEAWPSALAPWVLLPLILGSNSGSPRRAAALSAVAVALVGGVNASATFAVLPLGVIWILTRTGGPRRRSLMIWWPTFTLVGTLWWLVPLFVMGSYSPPFLDFIETTSVTTFPTTVFDALRGTSNWIPYVSPDSRAGNDLVTAGFLAVNSGVLLLTGFAGLIDRRNPHRPFLAISVLTGLLMVTAGHTGTVHGLFAGDIRTLLDGALAPLRNVHKFDPIIRLPLVIGLALVVERLLAARRATPRTTDDVGPMLERVNQTAVLGLVMVGLIGSFSPILVGRLEPANPVAEVPTYWKQTATYLAAHPGDGTALLAPGSAFGTYLWGSPKDEPLQFLAHSPWAVRNAIPLAPVNNIRMLDTVEDRFAQGHGSIGFTRYLQRNGIGFLVVRNDLHPSSDVPDPVVVHQAIAQSPGLTRVAHFGPDVGGGAHLTTGKIRTVVNGGWQAEYPAVEIYRVPGVSSTTSGTSPTVVVGGPEDLLDLQDFHVIGTEPTVLGSDVDSHVEVGPGAAPYVLTDGLRRRERSYARIHDGYSATQAERDRARALNPHLDYLTAHQRRWQTVARYVGARSVTASSSESDSDAPGGSRRGELPYAAVDGSTATEWVSNPSRSGHIWWRVTLPEARDVGTVTVNLGSRAVDNGVVRVRTENGVSAAQATGPREKVDLTPPPGRTRWVQVEAPGTNNRLMALADVSFDGLDVHRELVLPRVPDSWGDPSAVVLRADLDARRGCTQVDGSVRCAQDKDRPSEEATGVGRAFTLPEVGRFAPRMRVRPLAGEALDALILRGQPINITASSTAVPDPRASPIAAIDGDPGTTWIANVADFKPTLDLSWIGRRAISGVSMSTSDDVAARQPREITLIWPRGHRDVTLDADGQARFPAIRTARLRILVREAAFATDVGFDGRSSQIGVGIGELRLRGLPYVPTVLSTRVTRTSCGTGPQVSVNGTSYPTRVVATAARLFSGRPVPARICTAGQTATPTSPVDLRGGTNEVTVRGSDAFQFQSLVLRNTAAASAGGASYAAPSTRHGAVRTVIQPTVGGSHDVVNLGQNANPGWRAGQDGHTLAPVVLNGWQQGWQLRDSRPVVATFRPDALYRIGLGVGLLCLAVLIGATVLLGLRRRRGPEPPPLGEARVPWLLAYGLAGGGALLVAGWAGLLVAVIVAVGSAALRGELAQAGPWIFGGLCLLASVGYFFHPWADVAGWAGQESWPHYLVLAPVVAALIGLSPRPSGRRRDAGTSISR